MMVSFKPTAASPLPCLRQSGMAVRQRPCLLRHLLQSNLLQQNAWQGAAASSERSVRQQGGDRGAAATPEARVQPSEPTSMQVTMSLCTRTLCSRLPSSTL